LQSSETDAFRDEIRAFLARGLPAAPAPSFFTPERREYDCAWQRSLLDAGLGALGWPPEYGGRSVSVPMQMVFHEELAAASAPDSGCLFIALSHAGPTIATAGTQAQKERHLRAILRGDQVWCQGFSEPEAGSDLASIRTTGRVDGNRIIVNGTKIWTSYAHLADFCELLVSTNPDAGRHRGLTWMILDMRSPGVSVRPIRTLTGNPRFCEVQLVDVEVPLDAVVGEIDGGWRVAMSTLSFERGSGMVGRQVRTMQRISQLEHLAKENGAYRDSSVRQRLADCQRDAFVMRAMVLRSLRPRGGPPASGSVLRVFHSDLVARFTRLAVDVIGDDVVLLNGWSTEYLNELRSKTTAGTLDIQRNIIGERVLGLPK
jgi:alkylation response protein AidB-like acyl-CoA dehydrogenase